MLVALVLGLHLGGSLFPAALWGVHHLGFYPSWIQALCYLSVLALLAPPVNGFIHRLADHLAPFGRLFSQSRSQALLALGAACLGTCLFVAFPISHTLFGDSSARITEIAAELPPQGPWYALHSHDTWLRYHLHHLFATWWNWDARTSYVFLTDLFGFIFILASAGTAFLLGTDGTERFLLFGAQVSAGFVLLFFGYTEVYNSVVVSTLIFLWATLAYAGGKCPLWVPLLALLCVGFFHLMGLFTAPALLYAAIRRHGLERHIPSRLRAWLVPSLVIGSVAAGWLLFWILRPWAVIPLYGPIEAHAYKSVPYNFFSPGHLAEQFNQHLLVALPGWLGLFLGYLAGGNGTHRNEAYLRLLIVGALTSSAMMSLVNPALGRLDWDLMTIFAPGWVLMGTYFFVLRFRHKPSFKYCAVVLLSLSLFHTVPWIAVQRDLPRTVQSVEAMIELDPHRRGARNLKLGARFEEAGFLEAAIHQYEKALEWDDRNHLNYYNMGRALDKAGQVEGAIAYYQKCINLRPDYANGYNSTAKAHHKTGRLEAAIPYYEKTLELIEQQQQRTRPLVQPEADLLSAYDHLATIYHELGRFEQAISVCQRSLEQQPESAHAYFTMGVSQLRLKRYEAAVESFKQHLATEPDRAETHLNLGVAYAQTGQLNRAKETFKRFLSLAPHSPQAPKITEFLRENP